MAGVRRRANRRKRFELKRSAAHGRQFAKREKRLHGAMSVSPRSSQREGGKLPEFVASFERRARALPEGQHIGDGRHLVDRRSLREHEAPRPRRAFRRCSTRHRPNSTRATPCGSSAVRVNSEIAMRSSSRRPLGGNDPAPASDWHRAVMRTPQARRTPRQFDRARCEVESCRGNEKKNRRTSYDV